MHIQAKRIRCKQIEWLNEMFIYVCYRWAHIKITIFAIQFISNHINRFFVIKIHLTLHTICMLVSYIVHKPIDYEPLTPYFCYAMLCHDILLLLLLYGFFICCFAHIFRCENSIDAVEICDIKSIHKWWNHLDRSNGQSFWTKSICVQVRKWKIVTINTSSIPTEIEGKFDSLLAIPLSRCM